MAKIIRAEGGVHCTTLPMTGEAYRLRVPEEGPQQSLGRDFTVIPAAVRPFSANQPLRSILPAALVTSADFTIHLTVQTSPVLRKAITRLAKCWLGALPDGDTLVLHHNEIVATFRRESDSQCTDGRRARNCRQKTFHMRGGLNGNATDPV